MPKATTKKSVQDLAPKKTGGVKGGVTRRA